ncbi:unnamed protein product [Medioppia subpectinata]|uniref:Tr-type G domain-containing protein n=1 Tax=Medioppia subpectinata TaxID=1979941 RepID=A0A7R9KC87_9ACAR|nr:unnamed protein product [Medioppia subpectinata]CAG2100732.1 unnamed protein product [Medioppia subpectinata]
MATRFGQLDSRALSKLEKDAMENNKSSFALAYFTDKTEQERKRGVTIQTTLVKMETKKFAINFLDCPGHADYIKNATNGCKQSDLSIVVVPARFEASCSTEGTLKTHLTLAGILGSKNFIVCINKLDEVEIKNENSLETAFEAACEAVYKFLKRLGVKREAVIFLPISALKGHGAVLCGRVDYGIIKKGDVVKILPVGITSDVKSIEAHKQSIPEAPAGTNIGFVLNLKGDKTVMDKIKTGSLVGPSNDTNFNLQPFYIASCKFVCRDSGILVVCGNITDKITATEAKEKYDLDVAVVSGDKEAIKKSKAKK